MPHPTASRSAVLLLLASLCLLGASPAPAQIAPERPGKIKAANRRALREAKSTDSPYKDSHLDVTREHLKRGHSNPNQPQGSDNLRYKTGTAPNVKPAGFLGLRRDKTSTLMRKEDRQKGKKSEKSKSTAKK